MPYAIADAPRVAEVLPALAVREGELVLAPPRPVPVRADAYGKAFELVTRTDARVAALEALTGPKAVGTGFDYWAVHRRSAIVTGVAAMVGAMAGFGGAFELFQSGSNGWGALTALAGVAASAVVVAITTAEGRGDRSLAKRRALRIESKQLEPVLRDYADAPMDVRALAQDAVAARLHQADDSLSAKAAVTRDTQFITLPVDDTKKRAAQLMAGITRLLAPKSDPAEQNRALETICAVLGSATALERHEMAFALEQLVFVGEQARFRANPAAERRLWTAIQHGKCGKAPDGQTDGQAPLTPADAKGD